MRFASVRVVPFLGAGASAVYRPEDDHDGWDHTKPYLPFGAELALRKLARDANFPQSDLDPKDHALCARIFDRVVTPSGAKIAMKAADLAVLAGARDQTARVERILDELSRPESRIFTPVPHPEGKPTYEIFHDVLAHPILR